MKTKSTFLYILRLSMTLLLITAVVAAALGAVNSITKPRIEALTAEKIQLAIEQVLPGGGQPLSAEAVQAADPSGLVQTAYASEQGYAIQVAPKGFGGTIVMMVGVSRDGRVLGLKVISHAETAGLGDVAASDSEKGQQFRENFTSDSARAPFAVGTNVDAISSATITSKAVTAGVNAAVECAKNLG
jgi:electron transport complex protein RnfG